MRGLWLEINLDLIYGQENVLGVAQLV